MGPEPRQGAVPRPAHLLSGVVGAAERSQAAQLVHAEAGSHLPLFVGGRRPSLDSRENKRPHRVSATWRPSHDGPCRNMPFRRVSIVTLDGERAPLRCKSWKCSDCGPWLRRRLRKEVIDQADKHGLHRFFTVTMRPGARQLTLKDRYVELHATWRRFVKRRERRDGGRRWRYLKVTEAHQDNTPHVHGLMPSFVDIRQFRADWVAAGGGIHVWLEYIDVHRVAAYLSKYLVKDDLPLPKGCRKYAAGGGVDLRGVRPKGQRGTCRIEFWGPRLGRQDGWEPVYDPRPLIGALQRSLKPPEALRQAVLGVAQRRELQHVVDNLVVCVVCGGDHLRHPT